MADCKPYYVLRITCARATATLAARGGGSSHFDRLRPLSHQHSTPHGETRRPRQRGRLARPDPHRTAHPTDPPGGHSIKALRTAAAGLAALSLLITGCQTTTGTPTNQTTTPLAVNTTNPTQEAKDGAWTAIKGMHKAIDKIAANGWKSIEPVEKYAKGQPVTLQKNIAATYRPDARFGTGTTKLSKFSTTNIDLDTKTVKAKVCVDTRGAKLHESNGSAVKINPQFPLKAWKTYTVTYDEVQGTWLVTKFDSSGSKKC